MGRSISDIEVVIRVNDGTEMEEFLEKIRSTLPMIKIEEDAEIIPTPALRIGNIYYHGIPRHREAEAFEEIIRIVGSEHDSRLPSIDSVEIKIFTTPTCRYCTRAVIAAAKLARASEKIVLHIYDATEFSALADSYEVTAVPKIVINDIIFIEAQATEKKYRELLLKAIEHLRGSKHRPEG